MRTRASRRPAGRRTGSGSSGSSIPPGGSGSLPDFAWIRTCSGWSSTTEAGGPSRPRDPPRPATPTHSAAPAPSSSSAAPVTYSGSASNVPATSSSRTPSAAQPRAERMALERRDGGDRVPHDLLAGDARRLGGEHQPVGEDGDGERLDVVGERVVAAVD